MLYKGDDAPNLITIYLENNTDFKITRAELKIGNLPVIVFNNPVFPLKVSLTRKQTLALKHHNDCYLAVYDKDGNKRTCEGRLLLIAKEEVVK